MLLQLQMLLTEAHFECDQEELRHKLDTIEALLSEGVLFRDKPPDSSERNTINIILSQMDELRIHKLGYPDWRKFAGQTRSL